MKSDANLNKAILALKRCIQATFSLEKWRELGYLTDTIKIIREHPRLLRSLDWGDNDYGDCILRVLPHVVGERGENLAIVEEFVQLESWLRENDSKLHNELYGPGDLVPLAQVEGMGAIHDVKELNRHAIRIRESIADDPGQAIGSAKELLETVLKTVLGEHGAKSKDDIQELSKRAWREIGLAPDSFDKSLPGAEVIRRTLNNLVQVVVGVDEIRNLYGTGHGRSRAPEPNTAHARLVVNAAVTVATFLLEICPTRGVRPTIEPPQDNDATEG